MKNRNISYFVALLSITIGLFIIQSCSKDNGCTKQAWYQDSDGDGFGNASNPQQSCTQPADYVADNTDFDDFNANLNPNAIEIADNEIDENGDGNYAYNLFVDNDGDGYGMVSSLVNVPNIINGSSGLPDGYSQVGGDCDDTDSHTHPGAIETANDGVDSNCDGLD